MAVKTKQEILDAIIAHFGEQSDDETLTLLEDVTDTFTDLETRASGDGTDWKAMYEENDASWRKKYRERFSSTEPPIDGPANEPEPEPQKLTFEDLFSFN